MRRIFFTALGAICIIVSVYCAWKEEYDRATYNLVLAIWTFDNGK